MNENKCPYCHENADDGYLYAVEHKSTTQDNLMWKCILILARRIYDLEDNNYVK